MPPLPTISNVYRVALNWQGAGGQTAINVIHVRRAATTASAVATAVDTNVQANMWAQVANSAGVIRLDVTPLDGTSASFPLTVSGAKWTGTAGAFDHVPQVAEVVTLKTALRGRRVRGRFYTPFIAESAVSNGGIVGFATAQGAWTTFISNMSAAGFPLVVASYVAQSAQDVTAAIVQSVAGTQRRRQSRLRH